jgi:putative zinc finger/helix-turn-helix YgiT family protein
MVNNKKDLCLLCPSDKELVLLEVNEVVEVRGESFKVKGKYLTCPDCGEQQYDPKTCISVRDVAYREYRKKHGMVQPEEIKKFRDANNLKQKQFSDQLGFGAVTLSRYENGALQDKAHDKMLRAAIERGGSQRLCISKNPWIYMKSQIIDSSGEIFNWCPEVSGTSSKKPPIGKPREEKLAA